MTEASENIAPQEEIQPQKLTKITVDERSARRIRSGYPWVFRSELTGKTAAENGSVVHFVNSNNQILGTGFYNGVPQLVGRVITRNAHTVIDRDFVHANISSALKFREALYGQPFYRLIHAESDNFPGLIVDRYGDVLVVQVNTAGMETLYPLLQECLIELIKPRAIVLRNDTPAREQEGLPQETKTAYGTLEGNEVQIIENGVSFYVDVVEGQKTGWFFDQRDNRAFVAGFAKDKSVLDVFCHTGGFGITALAKGAASCVFVDASEKALADTQRNAVLNKVEKKCAYVEGRAFNVIEAQVAEGKKYGVVCVDPPAFIKSKKDMPVGLKAYQKLARLSAQLVEKGGYLFFASCSYNASLNDLLEHVTDGIAKSGRPFQLIRTAGSACDHPVHPQLPETGYLKALTFRFLD